MASAFVTPTVLAARTSFTTTTSSTTLTTTTPSLVVVARRPRPHLTPLCSTANVNRGSPFPRPVSSSPSTNTTSANATPLPGDLQAVTILGRTFHLSGRLMLILTPALWGGYTVSVRLLYTLPWALSPAVFNTIRLFLASCIVLPGLLQHRRAHIQRHGFRTNTPWLGTAQARGGVEIGIWTFLVNVLQIAGIKYSSASRAAFISQLNSVLVPFAACATGMEGSVGIPVYIASLLSVAGVALFSLDDFASPFCLAGEGVLLASAFAGAAFVLRCKKHAAHDDPHVVIGMKICAQFLFSLLFIMPMLLKRFGPALLMGNFTSLKLTFFALFQGSTPALLLINFLLVLYNGVCISWLSSIFHVQGQKAVSASEGAVVFASTPIWSAALAIPLGERFGLRGVIGAAFIVFATLLASVKKRNPSNVPSVDAPKLKHHHQQQPRNGNQLKPKNA